MNHLCAANMSSNLRNTLQQSLTTLVQRDLVRNYGALFDGEEVEQRRSSEKHIGGIARLMTKMIVDPSNYPLFADVIGVRLPFALLPKYSHI